MTDPFKEFFGTISGYKQKYEDAAAKLVVANTTVVELTSQLDKANETIKQLEQLAPHPIPPEISVVYEKDSTWVQERLDSMHLNIKQLNLDNKYRLVNQSTFLNIVAWDWVDKQNYQKEIFDCENFAIAFKSHVDWYFGLNQVGIVLDYKSGHSYNLVLFPDNNIMVLEPESDALVIWTNRVVVFYSLEGATVLI